MKKQCLSLLLALTMVVSMAATANAASLKAFTDVNKGSWYAGAVYATVKAGIINGTGNGSTFSPTKEISRAELAKLLAVSVASSSELESYKNEAKFSDVSASHWAAAYINWCAANGVISGDENGMFLPNNTMTRTEIAVSLYNLAQVSDKISLSATKPETTYLDDAEIPEEAKEAVYFCQYTGLLEGSDGKFMPANNLTRAQVVTIFCRLLNITPLSASEIPEAKKAYVAPKYYTTTVAGIKANVVEFNPQNGYKSSAVLANNKLYSSENAANIVSRNNGVVAVNGAFFNCYSGGDLTTHATIINNGSLVRLDTANTPYKPTFVVDSNGKASIEFLKVHQTVSLYRNGEKIHSDLTDVGTNFALGNNDSTDMIYTRAFGTVVPGTVANAAVVDANGIVTKVYKGTTNNVPIPENGYVLFERVVRHQWDTFLTTCEVGDKIVRTLSYEGSSTQNIVTALSCGPTLVKGGAAYGNATTYAQEGFSEAKIVSASAGRMAIGVKADGTVVIVNATGTMPQMSKVMVGLGCKTAMNLDGGASAALYANGWKINAGRQLSNMLIFSKA